MNRLDALSETEFEQLLQPLWQYLGVFDTPRRCDVIFVFGGLDLDIPRRAGELYKMRLAPKLLVSGAKGPYTAKVFQESEAETFRSELVRSGVPGEAILLESSATNALENVLFGMSALRRAGIVPDSAILVSKTFMMRRSAATFARQYPAVSTYCCPPLSRVHVAQDRSREDFVKRLLSELQRLSDYAEKGDIAPQPLPVELSNVAVHLKTYFS